MTVSFTGHRPDVLGGYDKNAPLNVHVRNFLRSAIERLSAKGCKRFISGGALGVDQWAAEIVKEYNDHQLVIALPFKDYGENWPESSRQELEKLKQGAEVVVVCEGGYETWKNFKRNEYMIDNSEVVVAVWNGSVTGGTASAIRAFKKRAGKEIIRFNPITLQEEPIL